MIKKPSWWYSAHADLTPDVSINRWWSENIEPLVERLEELEEMLGMGDLKVGDKVRVYDLHRLANNEVFGKIVKVNDLGVKVELDPEFLYLLGQNKDKDFWVGMKQCEKVEEPDELEVDPTIKGFKIKVDPSLKEGEWYIMADSEHRAKEILEGNSEQ